LIVFTPPPLPPWEGIHPLVVHFPIALLLVAPVFLLLAFVPKVGHCFAWAALALMALGTAGAYVAVESGEAGARLVVQTPQIAPVLARHADLAGDVRLVFTVLTAVYAVILIVPPVLKKVRVLKKDLPRAVPIVAQLVVLAAYLLCTLILANVGHLGGRLVHQYGVQAWFTGS
jgi:uncharacterized membrane protein